MRVHVTFHYHALPTRRPPRFDCGTDHERDSKFSIMFRMQSNCHGSGRWWCCSRSPREDAKGKARKNATRWRDMSKRKRGCWLGLARYGKTMDPAGSPCPFGGSCSSTNHRGRHSHNGGPRKVRHRFVTLTGGKHWCWMALTCRPPLLGHLFELEWHTRGDKTLLLTMSTPDSLHHPCLDLHKPTHIRVHHNEQPKQ